MSLRPPRDESIGLSSFPPSPDPVLGRTHWDDDDDNAVLVMPLNYILMNSCNKFIPFFMAVLFHRSV